MDTEHFVSFDIKIYLNLIVTGGEAEVARSWTKLEELEADSAFRKLVNCESLLRDMLNDHILNVEEIPKLMRWFSKYLDEELFDTNPISNDVATMLRNIEIGSMTNLTMILQTLLEYKVYIPEHANHSKLCEAAITCLSSFLMPQESKGILEFNENATRIQNFIRTMCLSTKNAESENLIFVCLQTLYKIISDTKRKEDPGPGLAAVLQMVDPSVIPRAVQWILSDSQSDDQLAQALKVLCLWLPKWRGDRLNIWVMEFIHGLEKQHKFSILLKVTESTLDMMFPSLLVPITRQNTSAIIFYILKRRGSPNFVRNIIKNISRYLSYLKIEDSESSKECIQNIVDVIKVITLRYPRHPIFASIHESFPVEPRMHIVHEIYNGPMWINQTKEEESIIETPRSHCGKVGLSNLGNTCYMNSVLQALLMTKQFCHEVLTYKASHKVDEQPVLRKLQNLFTLLSYSKRISLAPTEILLASRPTYFLPGEQQDSSEFLCHLLDVLHEQEKAVSMGNCGNDSITDTKSKPDKAVNDLSLPVEEKGGIIKRWTTEEDLTEGVALQRKTQSLADFTKGEDLSQTQQLSDSHSNSTDSGIQLVGGEEITTQVSLVNRVLGGRSNITYQCAQCDTSSHNTDEFRDLQLCFPEEIQENQEVSVQDLINYYLTPEKLTGENKYRCDKCTKLCDAQRIIKILHAPAHLILILKHFRYDFDTRLRTKLRHKVIYNEVIQLPVSTSSCSMPEIYQLYAAVVHSGYSMDYGHYFTYACNSQQNWYKFNDSYVSITTFEDFKNLKPPDTPYILFYKRSVSSDSVYGEDKPDLSTLRKQLRDLVTNDTAAYIDELRHQAERSQWSRQSTTFLRRNENSDDENPPPGSCRGAVDIPANRFLY
ncbi:hypothetical protein KM043_016668 [Ampulex compressa]|nr:hypothetical protein KM043_016668 [Ampulex compressa]